MTTPAGLAAGSRGRPGAGWLVPALDALIEGAWIAVLDAKPFARHVIAESRGKPPCARIAIRLAFRPLAGTEPLRAKPRMVREERDELLADHAGRTENADGNRGHMFLQFSVSQKKSRRGL